MTPRYVFFQQYTSFFTHFTTMFESLTSSADENQGMKLASLLPRFSRHLLQLLGYCFRKVWKACVWKKTVLEWVSSLYRRRNVAASFFDISLVWLFTNGNSKLECELLENWRLASTASNGNSEITWRLILPRGYETIGLCLYPCKGCRYGKLSY